MFKSKVLLTLALVLLLVLCGATFASASGANQQGGDVAELGDSLYVALTDPNGSSLNKLPVAGGDFVNIDSQQKIGDLVVANGKVYYLRYDSPAYQIVSVEADDKLNIVAQFDGKEVSGLSYYDGMLYCLVGEELNDQLNTRLTLVDPESGDSDVLNTELSMSDYVINNDVIYYVSSNPEEQVSYTLEAEDQQIGGSWGTLFSMSINGSNPEQLLDKGCKDLKAYGNYIYLHNMEDNYPTRTSDGQLWPEGKLYRLNMQTNQLTSMNLSYDWDYYVTPDGVVVYTDQNVSLYPLEGGAAKQLMTPEALASVSATEKYAYVYEYTKGKLTQLPLEGGAAKALYSGGPIQNLVPDTSRDIEYQVDENGDPVLDENGDPVPVETPESEEEADSSDNSNSSSSNSGKTGGYIFPNSRTKKLTRSKILAVSKSKWGIGRNEIYARHGYVFKTKKYKDHFATKSWYKPGGFSSSSLNSTEWYNMELIRKMEIEYGLLDSDGRPSNDSSSSSGGTNTTSGHSGDIFKNSSKKKLTKSQVSGLSKSKLAIARNEILARHGYPFKTAQWKDYFGKKSWYKARKGYSDGDLNSIEWANIKLIKKYE